jgi:N-acetylglucosaminyldiphosphoundecaprenol N-acetyl-beta-D-mannosaminyltransferase
MKPESELAISPGQRREHVLGTPVDVLSWSEGIDRVFEWALRRESRTVRICDVQVS